MRGLRIIPMFLVLIVCTYLGMLFVEANREEVAIQVGQYQSPPVALGFVVLTSVLIGMIFCGFLCSVELMALYMQNRRLKRQVVAEDIEEPEDKEKSSNVISSRTSGRFT